jgi:thiamine kinase-like enzyme
MVARHVADTEQLERILRALSLTLGPLEGAPASLPGGITNHNFRVTLGGERYVVRVHGHDTEQLGIDRRSERRARQTAAELGIAPALAEALEDCLVTRFVDGEHFDPGAAAEHAGEIAHALRRFHDSRVTLPTRFWVPELLADYAMRLHEHGGTPPAAFTRAQTLAARIGAAVTPADPRPCHNDLLAGNLIRVREDRRLLIVDWEYAGMGHPCFDLGNLSVNNDFDEIADERLLSAYHGAPPSDRQRAELRLMRVLSDAREGAWGVLQARISQLDFDFERYARTHFERMDDAAADPRFAECLELVGASGGADGGAGAEATEEHGGQAA